MFFPGILTTMTASAVHSAKQQQAFNVFCLDNKDYSLKFCWSGDFLRAFNPDVQKITHLVKNDIFLSQYAKFEMTEKLETGKITDALVMESYHGIDKGMKNPSFDLYRQNILVAHHGVGDIWSEKAQCKPNAQVKLACQYVGLLEPSHRRIKTYQTLKENICYQQDENFRAYARQKDFPVIAIAPQKDAYLAISSRKVTDAMVLHSANIYNKMDALINVSQLWRLQNN